MTETNPISAVKQFLQLWADDLASVLNQTGVEAAVGNAADLESANPETDTNAAGASVRFFCGGQLRGELLCCAGQVSALALAQSRSFFFSKKADRSRRCRQF